MMKTTIVIALVVLALCSVSEGAQRRREATSFVELSGRAQASLCQIKDESGNIQQWNCPFENPVCCSFAAKACCPTGYYCDESQSPVQCRKGSAPAAVSNNAGVQTIHVFPKITINSAPSPAAAESSGPSPAAESSGPTGTLTSPSSSSSSSVGMGESSMSSPMGESSTQVKVPPFRQNIIIVKNINVLTKAQQPAPPPPKESSEESSERSEHSSENSESSHAESSERSEQSELSARS